MTRQCLAAVVLLFVVSCDSWEPQFPNHPRPDSGRGVERGASGSYDWLNGFRLDDARDELLPQSKREAYRRSAVRMALRTVIDSVKSPTFLDSVPYRLPDPLIDLYYHALVHVYNSVSPARDSVVFIYPVENAFYHVSPNVLLIGLEDSVAFESNWRSGSILTGIPDLDTLIARHDLILVRATRLSSPTFVFETPYPVFLAPLADSLEMFPQIRWAQASGAGGDGHEIEIEIGASTLSSTYIYAWGDCLNGCIFEHYWQFQVSNVGEATFVRSWGDALHSR